jgi:type II secretory pathway pseudopilin PulG
MKGRAGYSLLEVLLAFVIMTVVLAALIPGQAQLLNRASLQEDRLLAFDYALSRAARLGIETPLEIGASEEIYRDWLITTNISEGDTAELNVDTLHIEITVNQAGSGHLATFQTMAVTP